jgi:protein TonB
MKKTLLIAFISFSLFVSRAQKSDALKSFKPDTLIFTAVEHYPEFPGGVSEFYRYLSKDINYSLSDKKQGYQASFLFDFIVEKDGSISTVKELRRIPNTDIGKLLIKRIKESPKWKPAIQEGIPVRYRCNLPLHF